MTKNEIVGRLKDGGLDASSTNRSAAVYVADAMAGRAVPGWFAFRIVCDSEDTEIRARAILSRWYDIDVNGNGVWRLKSKNRVPLMAIKRGGPTPPEPPATEKDLYIEATYGSSSVYALVNISDQLPDRFNIKYSKDGTTWKNLNIDYDAGQSESIQLTQGSKVWFRGVNTMLGCYNPDAGINRSFSFHFGGNTNRKFHVGGTVQSLVDGSGESLTAIPMEQLFNNNDIYEITVDEGLLPATTLVEGCYASMFSNCAKLKNTPSLPATVLAKNCYDNMFGSCKALTQGPALPASTLAERCYNQMFSSCYELAAVTCLAEDISATDCLQDWLSIVHGTGTFTKKAGVVYPSGNSGIPSGWTVVEV